MLTKRMCGKVMWIDLESPTKDEVKMLQDKYGISSLVSKELLSPTLRPKVDVYDNYLYLILHFPTVIHPRNGKREQEIDFIIGKDFLITVGYDSGDKFIKLFNPDTILNACDENDEHAGFIFFRMLQDTYNSIAHDLDHIKKDLRKIENRIFSGDEHKMVHEISKTSRRLLDFRVATRPHREVLESFEVAGSEFFGKSFDYHLSAIVAEYYKIFTMFENSKDTLNELRETNDSLLSTRSNDIMRVLTILAFVTFPLSLFTSLFGMNTVVLPIVGHPYDFWIIVGIMLIAMLTFFGFFKYKKWL